MRCCECKSLACGPAVGLGPKLLTIPSTKCGKCACSQPSCSKRKPEKLVQTIPLIESNRCPTPRNSFSCIRERTPVTCRHSSALYNSEYPQSCCCNHSTKSYYTKPAYTPKCCHSSKTATRSSWKIHKRKNNLNAKSEEKNPHLKSLEWEYNFLMRLMAKEFCKLARQCRRTCMCTTCSKCSHDFSETSNYYCDSSLEFTAQLQKLEQCDIPCRSPHLISKVAEKYCKLVQRYNNMVETRNRPCCMAEQKCCAAQTNTNGCMPAEDYCDRKQNMPNCPNCSLPAEEHCCSRKDVECQTIEDGDTQVKSRGTQATATCCNATAEHNQNCCRNQTMPNCSTTAKATFYSNNPSEQCRRNSKSNSRNQATYNGSYPSYTLENDYKNGYGKQTMSNSCAAKSTIKICYSPEENCFSGIATDECLKPNDADTVVCLIPRKSQANCGESFYTDNECCCEDETSSIVPPTKQRMQRLSFEEEAIFEECTKVEGTAEEILRMNCICKKNSFTYLWAI